MKWLLALSLLTVQQSCAQDSVLVRYSTALDSLSEMIQAPGAASFRKAVFLTENAYLDGRFHEADFNRQIFILAALVKGFIKANRLDTYKYPDSNNVQLNFGVFKVLKDSITILLPKGAIFKTTPFTYDFTDFDGTKAWSNMFVIKLLATHKGNCHSLPYLYKMVADELGASCWLALAPNHTYISNRCMETGWYNTELTSGQFPIDAWIMASGYLPLKAVQSGIYMDTLSNRESIALCMLDLAKGYEHKTHNYADGFILRCCDLSLHYFPLNVQAMLLKAETLKHIYETQRAKNPPAAKQTYAAMESLYLKLFDLGYREMPAQMYLQWLQSINKEKEKYTNRQIKTLLGSRPEHNRGN